MRVLLVEDEKLIADAVKVSMTRDGYHVDWVADANSAEDALVTSQFDLVILDLGLPGRDGLSLLRWLRNTDRNEPVVILTAREAVENRIEGLDLGADDYMTKPFDMKELLARARAQIRRANGRSAPRLTHGDIEVDPAAHTVTHKGEVVEISPLAFQVLVLLLERKGRVVSKDDLAESLYGWEEGAESNTVEVYVSQIRRRLTGDLIRTIRGIGYIIDKD
ncbi:response regulator transcription factor [Parasedimentitalea psychrophila]|uniref:Response regulator transcription factor n=1 Tax=Parasedimentitalea psychrophila TaxID=2997337 RepID=A0A9Y2L5J6_9RHOB|nr:response regulator transcription factor [Parasedimentitalea psychrophila]WIY27787.1 response regulator transcription factor [Parasedimentitalea psychrophila]